MKIFDAHVANDRPPCYEVKLLVIARDCADAAITIASVYPTATFVSLLESHRDKLPLFPKE
jgi:hypothetical protein